ncbi:MAG: hypothetical protein QXG71_02620 [Nanopusillaceae archaeon]
MKKDKLVIAIYSFFTSLSYSLMLYSIRNFGYNDVYYSYFLTCVNFGILFSSLVYGNIKINEKNYFLYNFIGFFAILLSFFFLYYAENFFYLLLSSIFMYFLGSSINFIIIRSKKDISLYYYFSLYGLFGLLAIQIFLFLNLNFKIIVLLSFFFVFLSIIFLFSFYFKKLLKILFYYFAEEYGILATTEKILNYIENEDGSDLFRFVGKPSKISIINFIIAFFYLIYWTALITISSAYNTFFPIFLFLNNLGLTVSYKILPKKENNSDLFLNSLYGLILRFFGVLFLLFVYNIGFYNVLLLSLFYLLASISWGIFSFYMDDYILNKKENEYGFVSFFRNLAAILGSIFVGIFGIELSLIFSIFVFLLILILIFIFRKYI